MNEKQYFVILWESEINSMKTGNQLLVYSAIKSYSSNGKKEIDLSIRDIAKRSKLSVGEIYKIIPELIQLNLIQRVGQKARRGGSVSIYKVFTTRTVNNRKRSGDEQLNDESVHLGELSVHDSGTKCTPIKVSKVSNKITGNTLKDKKVGAGSKKLTIGGMDPFKFVDKLYEYHVTEGRGKK